MWTSTTSGAKFKYLYFTCNALIGLAEEVCTVYEPQEGAYWALVPKKIVCGSCCEDGCCKSQDSNNVATYVCVAIAVIVIMSVGVYFWAREYLKRRRTIRDAVSQFQECSESTASDQPDSPRPSRFENFNQPHPTAPPPEVPLTPPPSYDVAVRLPPPYNQTEKVESINDK